MTKLSTWRFMADKTHGGDRKSPSDRRLGVVHMPDTTVFCFQDNEDHPPPSPDRRWRKVSASSSSQANSVSSTPPLQTGSVSPISPSSSTQAILSPSPPPRESQRPTTASDFRQRRRRFVTQKNNKSVDVQVMAVQSFSKQLSTHKIIPKSTHSDS